LQAQVLLAGVFLARKANNAPIVLVSVYGVYLFVSPDTASELFFIVLNNASAVFIIKIAFI
jgi:hypothetical protein